jgi:alcohol dehydrogenase
MLLTALTQPCGAQPAGARGTFTAAGSARQPDIGSDQLAAISRYTIPYGGLPRSRPTAGETLVVTGASGAYGSHAVLVALAMGAGPVVAAGRSRAALDALVNVVG